MNKDTSSVTLSVGKIKDGFVLDHIEAGKSMELYRYLGLDNLDCCVAIIKNVPSKLMGKKDIIKIEGSLELINLDIIGFIDHNITVNIIKDGMIVEKKELSLPNTITDVIKCKNPRCITATEHYVPQMFKLVDKEKALYCCEYCDSIYKAGPQAETVDLFE